ncbi:MAG TPA: DUF4382 domain-containing protein [Gemmatimonadales bacterium]|jgi:hypothetical protein
MSQRVVMPVLAAVALAGWAACYQDDPVANIAPGTALTRVLLTDGPFPFDTVQSVNIYVVSVAASTEPDTGGSADSTHWVTITEPKRRVDLLALQAGTTTLVGEGGIPADQYRAIRLIIDVDSSNIRFKGGSAAVVTWGGSGQQAIHAFVEAALDVPAAGAEIVIDFDVGRSFHYDDFGDGSFNFFPWIRAVNRAATGSLAGTVYGDPDTGLTAPIENATVSGYGASQGTWQIFSTARTDAAGHYRLAYLLPGTYIVQTNAPRAGGWATAYDSGAVVTRGAETTHNVTLPQFSGAVYILGASSMLAGHTNELEAIVVNAQNQQEPTPTVTWATADTGVVFLTDSSRAGKYAWVTSKAVGQARVVATSGALSDTLRITVYPDSSLASLAAPRRHP